MRYAQPEVRGRGRADLITLVVLLAVSGVLAVLTPGQQAGIAVAFRSTALYPFLELHRAFAERVRLRGRFETLRAERDALTERLVESRQMAEIGRRLRVMADLGALEDGSFTPADLIPGRPRIGDSNVFMLRGPDLASIDPPVGVFTGEGLVGVLRSIDEVGALGEFWSHPDFRVSVETAVGSISGIVRADRDETGQALMVLDGAPFQEEIAPGTLLVTSGLAGVYPPGIPVGVVRSIAGEESGWTKSYRVEPAVRPETADVVLVWRRPVAQ